MKDIKVEPLGEDDIEQIELILEIKYDQISYAHMQQYIEILYNKYKEFIDGA